ncbi:MAG: hypothetical protein LBU37_09015, partial [Tannerellaceae bacterium]|nr:hypothetical protein [Tannerellaceae bacterium]
MPADNTISEGFPKLNTLLFAFSGVSVSNSALNRSFIAFSSVSCSVWERTSFSDDFAGVAFLFGRLSVTLNGFALPFFAGVALTCFFFDDFGLSSSSLS